MKDIIFDDFQNCVNDSLIRHKSILDILTKYSESTSKVNRSVAKAVNSMWLHKYFCSETTYSTRAFRF